LSLLTTTPVRFSFAGLLAAGVVLALVGVVVVGVLDVSVLALDAVLALDELVLLGVLVEAELAAAAPLEPPVLAADDPLAAPPAPVSALEPLDVPLVSVELVPDGDEVLAGGGLDAPTSATMRC
jgi:hypothetical protein